MRALIVLLALCTACGGAAPGATRSAPAAATDCHPVDTSEPLAVSRIEADGVVIHTLTAPDSSVGVTSHIIETSEHLVVLDTQLFRDYATAVRAYVDGLGKPIDRVVITHGHPDHYLGLEMFQDAPSYALAATQQHIRQRQRFHIRFHREVEHECDAVADRAIVPEHVLAEGEYVLDGITIVFERTRRGEDDDQLVVRVPAAGVLVLQDLIANDYHAFTAGGMIPHWIELLRGYGAEQDVRHVLAGHGPPGGPEVIAEMIAYLEAVQPLHDPGLSREQFVAAFQERWPERRGMYLVNLMATMREVE